MCVVRGETNIARFTSEEAGGERGRREEGIE
jgi:hypothetical protein